MRPTEEFTPLRIVKKSLTDSNRCAYRVYKSEDEYVTVEAATALEAFRESGIAEPHRILRETRFMERLVDQSKFSENEELIETGSDGASSSGASSGGFTPHAALQQAVPPIEVQRPDTVQPAKSQPEDGGMQAVLENPPPAEVVLSPDDVEKLLESGE